MEKLVYIFNTLYETQSITKTAQLCGKTKSSISRSLMLLENAIGEKLFFRNGCCGLSATRNGEQFYFYSKQIIGFYTSLSKHFSYQHDNNDVNICCHPLATEYILKLKALKHTSVNMFVENRERAVNDLLNNKYDLILFPFENIELSKINKFLLDIEIIKPYNLCLFFNKKNIYAKIKPKDIDWQLFNDMHIVPIDNEISFGSYTPILSKKKFCFNISSLDLNLIKYGIERDLWIAAVGEEFKKICNASTTVMKEMKRCNHIFQEIHWCLCCKRNNSKRFQQIITELKQKNIY